MEQKFKKKIRACIAGIIACVLIIVLFCFGVAITATSNTKLGNDDLRSKIYTKVIIAALPHSITGSDNGKEVTFYMDYNKDYDSEKDEPLKQYLPYYFEGDKRIDLPDGVYVSPTTGKEMQVTIGFFLRGANKLKVLSSVFKVLIAILIVGSIALIIFLSYLIWCYKQDKKDAEFIDAKRRRAEKYKNQD